MRWSLLALLVLSACDEDEVQDFYQCPVTGSLEPAVAAAGDDVLARVSPLTSLYDTEVQVQGLAAEVTDVTVEDCALCDACRQTENCNACEACTVCDEACDTCEESLTFVVPDQVQDGSAAVVIINRYGVSEDLALTIESPEATR